MNEFIRYDAAKPDHNVLSFHPFASLFPVMSDAEFDELQRDMQVRGQREPIILYQGKILDGRHRYRACRALGMEPKINVYDGDDPLGFVISMNLHRRHLTESQRQLVASKLSTISHGGNRKNYQETNSSLDMSLQNAADLLNVGITGVKLAKKVLEKGSSELIQEVEAGNIAVSAASQIIEQPTATQKKILTDIQQGETPAQAIKKHVHVAHHTGNNEWYTPSGYIETARAVLGDIDLDPASSAIANQTVLAKRYFTVNEDGLTQAWHGRVWMNPPYSQPLIKQFTDKLCGALDARHIQEAIVLVNNATDTTWFQNMAQRASVICFPRQRIKFLSPEGDACGSPLQGQAILYFGEQNTTGFANLFSQYGFVLARV